MAKQLNVNLAFSADTSKAQAQIAALSKTLQEVAKMPGKASNLFDDTQIRRASQAALELQQHLSEAVNVNTGKLDLSRFSSSLKASNKDLSTYCNTLLSTGEKGQQAFLQLAQAIASADTPVTRVNKKLAEMGTTLKNTVRWQLSSSMLHGFMGAVQSAYGYAQDLNESLNNIRIVTGQNIDQMSKFAVEANRAARALSTTTTQYTDASLIFYQQGLSDSEVAARTEVTIKMANAAGQSAQIVSDQLTAVWNNFYDGSKSLEYYADVMTALGAATASSTDEIAGGLEKFAAIGQTIGLSYEYAASALATITANTRQSEEVVGTALKTIFARIQGLNLGETLEDGTSLNKYSEALNKVGISIFEQNGEIKKMDDILDEMAAKWGTLAKDQQIALAQTVAGVRQYTQLIALMDNWNAGDSDSMLANLETSYNASGTLQEQADIYAESWEAAQDRVTAAAENIYDSLINDEFFIDLLNGFEKVLETVGGLIDGLGGLQGVIGVVGSIFLNNFAKDMPQALENLRQNFMVFSGKAKQVMSETQSELNIVLKNQQANPALSESYKIQLEGISKVNQMKEKLVLASKELTSQERAEYQAKIDNVAAMYEEIAALAEKKKAAEDAAKASEKVAIGTATKSSTGVFINYTKQQDKISNLEQKSSDPDLSEEQSAAYEQALEAARQKAVELELEIENVKEAYKLTTEEVNALMGTSEDAEMLASAQKKVKTAVEETAKSFTEQIKKRSDLEGISISVKSQATAWKEVAKEVKKAQAEGNTKNLSKHVDETKQKMQQYLGVLKELAQDNGIELTEQELQDMASAIESMDVDNIDSVTEKFEIFADTVSTRADTAIDTLDQSIDELRADMSAMQFNEGEIAQMEQSAESAATAAQNLSNSLSNIGGVADENLEGTFKMSVALTQFASTAMSVSSLINGVKSAISVFSDESATGFEKVGAALSLLIPLMTTYNSLTALATTLKSADAVKTGLQVVATKLKTVADSGETAGIWAKVAAYIAEQIAAAPVLVITLALVAAFAALALVVTGVVMAVQAITDAYNKDADGAKEAAEQTKLLTERYEELASKAEDLKAAISEYDDAIDALNKLEKNTDEYAEALENANQKARDLIETYGLWDQYTYKDGLITFDEGALEQAQQKANAEADQAQVQMYQGKIYSNQADVRNETTNLRRFANKGYGSITNEETQIIAEVASQLKESLGGINPTAEQLIARLEELGISSGLDAQTLAHLEHVIDSNTVPKFLSLGESMSEAEKANKYYAEQILGMAIEDTYGEDARRMATDKDGNVDTNKYNQILNAFTDRAAQMEEQKGKDVASQYEAVEETVKDISTEGQLNRFLKNQDQEAVKQVLGENYDGKINNDKELGLLYASMMSGIDPSELTYVKGNGVGTVKDKEGNEIVSGVSDEVMRREIAKQVAMQGITNNYSESVGSNADGLDQLKTALDTMLSGAAKAADKYGADFSGAILDAIANEDFDSLDFSGLFSELSPEEMAELAGLDSQGILDMLGLDAPTLQALGYDVNTFTSAFSDALNDWKYTVDTTAIEEKAASLKEIADDIKVGDIIDQEAYDLLIAAGVNANQYFTQMEDGTYKLTGAAEQFKSVVENITVQDYLDKIKEFQSAQEYAITKIGEQYGQRNAQNVSDTSVVGSNLTLGAARADYIKTFEGDFGFTDEQLQLLNKRPSEYNLEDLQELANMVDIVNGKTAELQGQMLSTADSLDELNNRVNLANLEGVEVSYDAYSAALIDLASSYDNCTKEMERYQVALANGNKEELYAAECALKASIRIGEAAEAYDLSAESLEAQSRELMIANGWGEEYAETAAMMAISNQRMNKGVEKLAKNWKDWSKTLKSSDTTSQDYADILVELSDAVGDLVGWYDELSLSSEFVKDNMDLIEKASQGNVNAIIQLGAAVASYEVEQAQLNETLADGRVKTETGLANNALQAYIDKLGEGITAEEAFKRAQTGIQEGFDLIANNLDRLQNGASLESIFPEGGLEAWVEQLNAYAAATGMTAQQMQSMLSSVGVTANVQTDYQEQEMTVPSYREEVTNVHYKTMPYTFLSGDGNMYTGSTVVPEYTKATVPAEPLKTTGFVEVASISMDGVGETPSVPAPQFTGRQAPSKSAVNAGKSSGGGGSSSTPKEPSAPKKMETTGKEEVVERYKEVNDQLDDLSDEYEKASRSADRLWGEHRLDAIREQNELIKEQQELLAEKQKQAEKYMQQDRVALQQAAAAAGLAFSFDDKGNITNYTDQMTILYDQLAAAEAHYNSLSTGEDQDSYEETILEPLKDKIKDVEDAIELYEESKELFEELGLDIDDLQDQIMQNNYDIIMEGLELHISFNDEDLEIIDYYLSKLEDDFYQMAEAAALMASSEGNSQLTEYISNLEEYENTLNELNRAYAAGEITEAAYQEGLEEVRAGIRDNLSSLVELDKTMMNYYGETLAMAQEELAKYTEQMEHQTAVLDHYKSLMEILGKETDYNAIGIILEGQAKTIENQVKVAKEAYAMYQSEADEKKRLLDEALAAGNHDAAAIYQKEWEAANKAAQEAQEDMLSKTEAWAESLRAILENKLSGFAQDLENALTGGTSFDTLTTSMERAASLQDEYLTTTNKIYETNKLMRTAQQAIDNSTSNIAKQKLKQFINETKQLQDQNKLSEYELEIQQAKYNLLLAEMALEDARDAKTVVRLKRDSEGNLGYVYTADQDKLAEAQQELEDAQNSLYNIGLEGANDYSEKYQQTMSEMYDTFTQLQEQYLSGEFETEAEYQEAMLKAKEYYYEKLKNYSSLHQVAITTDSRVIADAWSSDYSEMIFNTEDWMRAVTEYVSNVNLAFDEWEANVETITNQTLGPNLDALEDNVKDITDANDKLTDSIVGEGGVIDAIEEELDEVSNLTGKYANLRQQIQGLIADHEEMMVRMGNTPNPYNPPGTGSTGGSNGSGSGNSGGSSSGGSSGSSGSGSGSSSGSSSGGTDSSGVTAPDYSDTTKQGVALAIWNGGFGWGNGTTRRNRLDEKGFDPDEIQRIVDATNPNGNWRDRYGISDLTKYAYSSFDTGGYTGAWGSYGKFAMLHEKELILNPGETEDFLASLEVLRSIIKMIDLQSTASQLGGLLHSPSYYGNDSNDVLEQNVHIEASFPNVTDRNEIEEALNSIVNRASQYANRK